ELEGLDDGDDEFHGISSHGCTLASSIKQIPCHAGRCPESGNAGAFVVPGCTNIVRHAPNVSLKPVHDGAE
ncbi:hypothetical protein, partial [Escherichia coli]|uniref:hypothetical protein n=1 Tax=Escherichia coli TaxID=562 RepID=UPI00227FFA15